MNTNNKKIAIIGAGIAGLSTGCYLQMNGYDTQIFEMGKLPGGLCTSWKRKDYIFDGCLYWVVGSSPANSFHKFWQELGVIKDLKYIEFDEILRIEDENGKELVLYSDPDKLKDEMMKLSPEDKDLINELIGVVKNTPLNKMPIDKAPELYTFIDGIKVMFKIIPAIKFLKKWDMPLTVYAAKYKNPFLRSMLSKVFRDVYDFPTSSLLAMLTWMRKESGYPIGGSMAFSKAIEKRYFELGGKINYNSKVIKIITEDNKATGIKLEDNSIYNAEIIISAADGHYTIFEMLEGKYVNKEIIDIYNNFTPYPAIMHVSLGIDTGFDNISQVLNFPLEKTIVIDDKNSLERLNIKINNFDPTLVPKGKTSVITYFRADDEYWVSLKKENPEKYKDEKERIALKIIEALDKRFPGISSKIEVFDVATPATYIRYTGNWKGSHQGWIPDAKSFMTRIKNTLPGLKNFYMVGQWTQDGGGVPTGAMTARNITQVICKKDNKKFDTTIA